MWKNYVAEVAEAKLRALGVSSHDEEPSPHPSVSPSNASGIPSSHYPGQPFSPPIPTSSASSNPFPFAVAPFVPGGRASSVTSPGIQPTASPFSLHGKFNPRQSISIPASSSPFQLPPQQSPQNWAQQTLMMQSASRGESPLGLNGPVSPSSPFPQAGSPAFNAHQRHQSLQYPMLPHQQMAHFSQRGTPTLQELQEVDEEAPSKSPSKTPEASQHNPDGLQAEIDDAEYHLEEQLRNELEHEDYSPHNEMNKAHEAFRFPNSDFFPTSHGRHQSVQFAVPEQIASNSGPGPVLHHPRPHSRGQSLGHNLLMNHEAAGSQGNGSGSFGQFQHPPETSAPQWDDAEEIQTNPSNLGTPVQDFDLAGALQQNMHQRAFSTASNPWNDAPSTVDNSADRRMSHTSKPSSTKFNVDAPEFKFNPESSFQPGQFVFGGNAFQPQPTILQTYQVAQPPEPPAPSGQFTMATPSKIKPDAPSFSPGQSDFSFSASGPKFRPDAPAFTPFGSSVSESFASPVSGSESGRRGGSIFGNISIPDIDAVKPDKKSKAIPIVRPSSQPSSPPPAGENEDEDGRAAVDDSRVKRARAVAAADGDDVPLFAEASDAKEASASQAPDAEKTPQPDAAAEQKSGDEGAEAADTSMSSMMASEATDAKPTAPTSASSPSETSPQWASFEFESQADMQSFNHALPVGETQPSFKGHKKSLSAAAKPFTPGASISSITQEDKPVADGKTDAEEKRGPAAAPFNPDASDFKPEGFNPNVQEFKPVFNPSVSEFAPKLTLDANVFEPERLNPIATSFDPPRGEPEADEPRKSDENADEEAVEETKSVTSPSPSPVLHGVPQGLATSRFASPPPMPKGLGASRFAASPSPEPNVQEPSPVSSRGGEWEPETLDRQISLTPEPSAEEELGERQPEVELVETAEDEATKTAETGEPSFEEIDAVMRLINEEDPHKGVNYRGESSPTRQIPVTLDTNDTPFHLPPTQHFRHGAPSPSPSPSSRRYQAFRDESARPAMTPELGDPFEGHGSEHSHEGVVHRLNGSEMQPASDWDGDFSEEEQDKLEQRVQFFDGRVNDMVETVLSSRLDPVERTLYSIQRALVKLSSRGISGHRERRSASPDGDADDEDDEPGFNRSMSPQRSKRAEQVRTAVMDALASHQRSTPPAVPADSSMAQESVAVLKVLEEMKEQFGANMQLNSRGDDLRNVVEEVLERRMPQAPQAEDPENKIDGLQAKVAELEERLASEQARADKEMEERRVAQDTTSALQRKLDAAETKVEMEILNRSVFDQRIGDLEDNLRIQEHKTEAEVAGRRAAEDRLSEVQRLVRVSSEEENRLRESLDTSVHRVKALEQANGKSTMRVTLLEAAQSNAAQSQSELTNKINAMEGDLRSAQQEANQWRLEAERTAEGSRRLEADYTQALNEKKHLHRLLDTLGTQLEENERLRDNWRHKFVTIQEQMAGAAEQITQENARRTKREQALIARHEVLDAKLQAEARTRERLETEMERLEGIERQGMRATNESKRLETLLHELRTENHRIHQAAMRYQRELEDARESGAAEVQRVRGTLQTQLDDISNRANNVREDLEEQVSKLRGDLDQARIDVDSAKAQTEMLVEGAQVTKDAVIQQLIAKHQNEVEDMQTRHERQLSTAVDDGQTREQRLLERLSISTSRTEHLQDRVIHLEEKLEIAKEAAHAAAKAARSSPSELALSPPAAIQPKATRSMDLPEKVSPQALRESIMVLQEQLQEREQRIEELQHKVEDIDPEAATKIAKRDDEIVWLRELLAVRHGDLQDIIGTLSTESYDKDRVRDAVIRLKANLQMEEQERERAVNGGSAVRLPNIAQTIRETATPRVAQAVGPIAAAWGSWRKAQPSFGSFSGVLASPAAASPRNRTPSKATTSTQNNSALAGLMTPPASGLRETPPTSYPAPQPAAFSASGRRFTGQRSEQGRSSISSKRSERSERMSIGTPPRQTERPQPVTPPMMEQSGYDSDANPGDFDDHGFFDDDD